MAIAIFTHLIIQTEVKGGQSLDPMREFDKGVRHAYDLAYGT